MATVALKTITRTDREDNSPDGNPRYLVTFDDGTSARTVRDGQIGYGISNNAFQGSPVKVKFNDAGEVIGVRNGQAIRCGEEVD